MNIGWNIKRLRKEKGLTQTELADLSGITRVSIGNYERGNRNPDIEKLLSLAQALEITVPELLGYSVGTLEQTEESIGEKIKNIRINKGMTQEEFGDLLGASKGNVSTWESNSSLPSAWRLKILSELSGVTVSEFMGGKTTDITQFTTEELLREIKRRLE